MAGASSLLLCAVMIVLITCTEAEDQCIHEINPKVGYVNDHQFETIITHSGESVMEKASSYSMLFFLVRFVHGYR